MLAQSRIGYKAKSVAIGDAGHGARSGALSLEVRTHNEQSVLSTSPIYSFDPPVGSPYWRIDIFDFGEDKPNKPYIEVQAINYEEKPCVKVKKEKKKRIGVKAREDMDYEDLTRSETRAKKEMRRKVLMMKADRMLTLTTRGCIEDRKEFWKIVDRFRRLVQKHYGKDEFQAIVVLELQKRGAYHAHIALNKYYSVEVLRGYWTKAISGKMWHKGCGWESPGNVDMTRRRKGFWNRHKIAGYMAKYMKKEFESNPINSKRYTSWGKIERPARMTIYFPVMFDPHYLIKKTVEDLMVVKLKPGFETTVAGFELIWFCVDVN